MYLQIRKFNDNAFLVLTWYLLKFDLRMDVIWCFYNGKIKIRQKQNSQCENIDFFKYYYFILIYFNSNL